MPAAGWREAVAQARDAAERRDAHPRQKSIAIDDWRALEDYASRLDASLAPLRALVGRNELTQWINAHRTALALLCSCDPAELPPGEDGEALALLLDELSQTASARYMLDLETYDAFFEAVLAERVLRGARAAIRVCKSLDCSKHGFSGRRGSFLPAWIRRSGRRRS